MSSLLPNEAVEELIKSQLSSVKLIQQTNEDLLAFNVRSEDWLLEYGVCFGFF